MKKTIAEVLSDILFSALIIVPLIILIQRFFIMAGNNYIPESVIEECKSQIALIVFFGLTILLGFYFLMHLSCSFKAQKSNVIYKILLIMQIVLSLILLIVLGYCISVQLKTIIIVGAIVDALFVAFDICIIISWRKLQR